MTIRNEFELVDKGFKKIDSQIGLWVWVKSTPHRQYHSRCCSFQAQSCSSPRWRLSSILKEMLTYWCNDAIQELFWINSPSVWASRTPDNALLTQRQHQNYGYMFSFQKSLSLILKWMYTGQANTDFCTHPARHVWKIWSKPCWNKAFLWNTPRCFPVQQEAQRCCFVDSCL